MSLHAIAADAAYPRDFHVGFVTDRIEEATAFLAEILGIPAPTVGETPAPEVACTVYLGEPSDQITRQSYLEWDGIAFELLQPREEPGTLRDWLDRHGPGVHHLGFGVRDLDDSSARFARAGHPPLQSGGWDGGRYSYHDTEAALGTIVELLQFDRYRGR